MVRTAHQAAGRVHPVKHWRRGLLAVLLIVATFSNPVTAHGAPPPEFDGVVAQRLDRAITDAMAQASIPGAIVGLWGPGGSYVKALGLADKATGAPMRVDFFQRIGSVTKTFTITGILQLADAGRLGLDDPVSKYIDGVPNGDAITLRQLARMQSGLFNYSFTDAFQKALYADPYAPFTPEQLLGYAFAEPPVFPPGQGFQYSNTNTVLLGLVVEKLSGQSLADYVRDHILIPLGLGATNFPTDNAFPSPHAQGYADLGDGVPAVSTDWDPSWGWAAGAMTSNLDDMRRWAPVLATGSLLSPQLQGQRLQTVNGPGQPAKDGYGLGIFNLAGWIGHNGSLPGYQTVVVYLPPKDLTMVIFINTDIPYQGAEPSTVVATAITKVITPDHVYTLG
jgi:D-alanyl-D-alanine carboxypeptidase